VEFVGELALDDTVTIGQMADDQVSLALKLGVLRPFGVASGIASFSSRAAAKWSISQAVLVDADSNTDEFRRLSDEITDMAERVRLVLLIFRRGPAQVPAAVVQIWNNQGGQSFPISYGAAEGRGDVLTLSPDDAEDLRSLWIDLARASSNRTVGVALRRFGYAAERNRSDDAVVDLVITMESLFLSDAGTPVERGEMRLRLSQRGALFIEHDGLSKLQVLAFLRRAYDVRSAIVHGGAPPTELLKDARGNAVELSAFADEVEELARSALRKAVGQVASGGSWPPEWDSLLFPDSAYV
jgi:hypothetical protein